MQIDEETCPTPEGLLQCLRALSEEAACLGLTRTYAALQEAVETCQAETERDFVRTAAGLAAIFH